MEVRDGMSEHVLRVRWTLLAATPPEPWLNCPGCGGPKPHRSSGKMRVNANGRRIDAWLIYRCRDCQRSWNRPVLDRAPVGALPPGRLAALMANDAAEVRAVEFDLPGLRDKARRIDSFGVSVRRRRLSGGEDWRRLEIAIRAPEPVGLRLDRLLAREFRLSRAELETVLREDTLRILNARANRPVADGTCLILRPPPGQREIWALRSLSPPGGANAPCDAG